MTKLPTLSVLTLSALLSGCATYEAQPVHRVTAAEYSHGPVTYYSTPPVYYTSPTPTPVYAAPPVYVAPPIYVAPAPAFNMHIQSGPNYRRHPHRSDGRHKLRSGNAAGSQVGSPGWSGTVWSR